MNIHKLLALPNPAFMSYVDLLKLSMQGLTETLNFKSSSTKKNKKNDYVEYTISKSASTNDLSSHAVLDLNSGIATITISFSSPSTGVLSPKVIFNKPILSKNPFVPVSVELLTWEIKVTGFQDRDVHSLELSGQGSWEKQMGRTYVLVSGLWALTYKSGCFPFNLEGIYPHDISQSTFNYLTGPNSVRHERCGDALTQTRGKLVYDENGLKFVGKKTELHYINNKPVKELSTENDAQSTSPVSVTFYETPENPILLEIKGNLVSGEPILKNVTVTNHLTAERCDIRTSRPLFLGKGTLHIQGRVLKGIWTRSDGESFLRTTEPFIPKPGIECFGHALWGINGVFKKMVDGVGEMKLSQPHISSNHVFKGIWRDNSLHTPLIFSLENGSQVSGMSKWNIYHGFDGFLGQLDIKPASQNILIDAQGVCLNSGNLTALYSGCITANEVKYSVEKILPLPSGWGLHGSGSLQLSPSAPILVGTYVFDRVTFQQSFFDQKSAMWYTISGLTHIHSHIGG